MLFPKAKLASSIVTAWLGVMKTGPTAGDYCKKVKEQIKRLDCSSKMPTQLWDRLDKI
jgi:hypothetical protein